VLIPVIEPVLFTTPDMGFIRGAKAKFLATSDHPRSHELLIQLLLRDELYTRYDRVVAIMALRDGSPELRASASDLILQEFDRAAGVTERGSVSWNLTWLGELLISLAWLGHGVMVEERLAKPEIPMLSMTIQPMLLIEPLEVGPPEESLVLQRLEQALEDVSYRNWRYERQWVDRLIYRLGQLKSEKVVPILLDYLDGESYFGPYIEDALLSIGNDEVINGVHSQLRAAVDERRKYRNAELLWELTGSRMLPTLRKLAVEDGSEVQRWAWQKLGEVGTPQDLELLRPYRDYWRDDTPVGGGSAMATIRDRHNYDLNGPIVP
jgi:HEAT repeat protein